MFSMPGGVEWIIILIVALLIFGRRLPEVMRSIGKGVMEFKKGIRGIEDEIEDEGNTPKKIEDAPSSKTKRDKEEKAG